MALRDSWKQTKVFPVLRLWTMVGSDSRKARQALQFIDNHSPAEKAAFGVVAVLKHEGMPSFVSGALLDQFEDANYLVIDVPRRLKWASEKDVVSHINGEIAKIQIVSKIANANWAAQHVVGEADEDDADGLKMSETEELELLNAINDPNLNFV